MVFVWTSNYTKVNFQPKFSKTSTLEHKINVDENHQERHAKQQKNANHGPQTPRAKMQRGVVGATWVSGCKKLRIHGCKEGRKATDDQNKRVCCM